MAVQQNALVDVIDLISINHLVVVQEADELLLPLLVQISVFVILLTFDDPSKFLVFIVNVILVSNFLMSLLCQMLQLVNHRVFLSQLEVKFSNFLLDVAHSFYFCLLLFFFLVMCTSGFSLLCYKDVIFVDVVKLPLHVLLALF